MIVSSARATSAPTTPSTIDRDGGHARARVLTSRAVRVRVLPERTSPASARLSGNAEPAMWDRASAFARRSALRTTGSSATETICDTPPAGSFRMGSQDFYPEEQPVREVAVDAYWIDANPVTVAEFRRFV